MGVAMRGDLGGPSWIVAYRTQEGAFGLTQSSQRDSLQKWLDLGLMRNLDCIGGYHCSLFGSRTNHLKIFLTIGDLEILVKNQQPHYFHFVAVADYMIILVGVV